MAFFKDTVSPTREPVTPPRDALQREAEKPAVPEIPRRAVEPHDPRPAARVEAKESLIAADLTIEGKIEGSGHVRIAGRFKGDVQVQGNLTIENGAHLAGQVKAKQVIVAGELQGNIDGAGRVEVMETGVLVGDVKAGSESIAAGSRMRGQIEFGWGEKGAPKPEIPRGSGPTA